MWLVACALWLVDDNQKPQTRPRHYPHACGVNDTRESPLENVAPCKPECHHAACLASFAIDPSDLRLRAEGVGVGREASEEPSIRGQPESGYDGDISRRWQSQPAAGADGGL